MFSQFGLNGQLKIAGGCEYRLEIKFPLLGSIAVLKKQTSLEVNP